MRLVSRPRSGTFRVLLALALLAWTTLAVGAFGQTSPMQDARLDSSARTGMILALAMQDSSAHCDGMTNAAPKTASSQHVPAHGHDGGCPCCNGTGCACATVCGGMTAIACVAPVFDQAHIVMPFFDDRAPAAVHLAPPLRPPIV